MPLSPILSGSLSDRAHALPDRRLPVTRADAADGDRLPAVNVSWWDTARYCNTLSQREKLPLAYRFDTEESVAWDASSAGYRLPTEAEWEYACRAGTTGPPLRRVGRGRLVPRQLAGTAARGGRQAPERLGVVLGHLRRRGLPRRLNEPPPIAVTRAFGITEPPTLLSGGQGTTWVAGNLVFKPDAGGLHEWLSGALVGVVPAGFRLAMPVATQQGTCSHEGWSAIQWIEGAEPDYARVSIWQAILAAGRAFHRAVARLPRPGLLDARQDWWAQADRAAWGERAIRYHPEFAAVARRLQAALRPLGRSQVVHGDLTGNVLFAPGMPPAIIDISPYWRPPAFAEGVVVADAMCWHGAPASLLDDLGVPETAVARALLFRMATTNERITAETDTADIRAEADRYALAATAIGL